MNENKLSSIISELVGTRTYLPIDMNESILVFERNGYIHIFKYLGSVFGSTSAKAVAEKLIFMMGESEYHELVQEKVNGL